MCKQSSALFVWSDKERHTAVMSKHWAAADHVATGKLNPSNHQIKEGLWVNHGHERWLLLSKTTRDHLYKDGNKFFFFSFLFCKYIYIFLLKKMHIFNVVSDFLIPQYAFTVYIITQMYKCKIHGNYPTVQLTD